MIAFGIISLRAQDMAVGSNIVSRTLLSSDGARKFVYIKDEPLIINFLPVNE